jgi:hypothetical protein
MVVTQWSMNGIAYLSPLIQDRQVFYRERSAGAYRVGPYYWQRVLIELPFTIISSVIFTLIVWFGCGYPTDAGKYFIFLLVVFLCGETASAFAHCLSALSPTVEVATAIAPMILIVMMLFSGFLLTTSKIPVYWQYTVRYLSWIAYAFQAIGNSTFTGTPNEMVIPMYVRARVEYLVLYQCIQYAANAIMVHVQARPLLSFGSFFVMRPVNLVDCFIVYVVLSIRYCNQSDVRRPSWSNMGVFPLLASPAGFLC